MERQHEWTDPSTIYVFRAVADDRDDRMILRVRLPEETQTAMLLVDYNIPSLLTREFFHLVERAQELERENAELRTLFQRATEYLDVLGDEEDGDGIHNFVERLRNDFEHRVTTPPEPR